MTATTAELAPTTTGNDVLVWPEVAALLADHGLRPSYRQVDYWTRVGYVRAEERTYAGSGHWRVWSRDEVAILAAMLRLMGAGVELREAAAMARAGITTRSLTVQPGPDLTLHVGPGVWTV